MVDTLPKQIAEVSGRLFTADEVLMVGGISADTRTYFERCYAEDERELRTLRRKFGVNQRVLDAARVSG